MKKSIYLLSLVTLFVFTSCGDIEETEPADGQIVFYTNKDDGCGQIAVKLGTQSMGVVTNWSAISPDYGANGFVTMSLAPGTYTFDCTDDCSGSWSPTITVRDNVCTAQLLTR